MSENTLIEKIKQDAATKVAEVKDAGSAQVESIQRETKTAVAALQQAHTVAFEKKKAQLELVAVSRAKQAGNIAVQTTKRNQIDSIFDEVREELESQSEDDYVSFFQKYATEILPTGATVISVQAPAARSEETKKVLANFGFTSEVTADAGIKAGFIATTSDGVYDVTLNRLMGEKRAELEMNIVNRVMA